MEANLTLDTVKFYPFPGYNLYLLPKYRKVASGILVGIKDTLTADFEICKEMGESEDKSEIIKLEVWKKSCRFKIYALYVPPGSKPNLSSLSIDNKTIVIGDMNAHSTRWGYGDMNAAGKEIEDLLNSSLLDLIYDASDPPTYIHYNGSYTLDTIDKDTKPRI
ncbi:hypothetical protein CEXT_572251 [Caerostris extrusa]|uniref:Endonuclease/exonuclease/phosphatase domain-containing protein n=1 Tax=Caerostris extrusa TaxID=172846 RepID=A0AAV4RJV5_CAEEX|nr:hypothetical protein CEXT_572251 [Caerostris extrusa]